MAPHFNVSHWRPYLVVSCSEEVFFWPSTTPVPQTVQDPCWLSQSDLAKAGMVHSVCGCTLGVQVKLWDPLRTRAIPEHLRGVITTKRYTNPRLPLLLPFKLENSSIQLCRAGSLCALIQCLVTPCTWRDHTVSYKLRYCQCGHMKQVTGA